MNARTVELPAIGAAFEGGIFCGITLEAGERRALVLLPGDEEKNWKDASDWAAAQGGVLPSRIDMIVLYENVPGEFKSDWYWTGQTNARLGAYAWYQYFGGGSQNDDHKGFEGRCRAVRRVPI